MRAPRGRERTGTKRGEGPTRLLVCTRTNADYLGEILEHFGDHPGFEVRFVDFAGVSATDRYARTPQAIVEQTLTNGPRLPKAAEKDFREHLEWADVVFIEWCTALAALLTQVDPRDTRIVVRLHSYEAFTQWPHLIDMSRVDDMVFVSDHLRDFAVQAIPGLTEENAPRLHVLTNPMRLQRFVRPKHEDARFTVALVGASKLVKDPRWAIDVLRRLRRRDERYRLLLIRSSFQDVSAATHQYAEGLAADLAELAPAGAVEALKHTDDVPSVLERAGVVLSSSVRESFHMGLVEAVASGAVPVVRDWPYFPGAARRLFPPDWVVDSPEEAAQRILALTADERVWEETRAAARVHVLERWDWSITSRDFERLLLRDAPPT